MSDLMKKKLEIIKLKDRNPKRSDSAKGVYHA